MEWYAQFWDLLPVALGPELEPLWSAALDKTRPDLSCRKSVVAWLWRQRCAMDPEFKDPYTSVCKTIASYSSDCGAKKKAKTCRKRK